ncbi:sulfatase [bacterium]|nr:sulfatase [bacterium]
MKQTKNTKLAMLVIVTILSAISSDPVNGQTTSEQQTPNVLLIMADDLGWKDLHCQGNDKIRTPNLDRLSTQGARFTDAYAAAPVCSPTRAAIITGLAPARLKITQHGPDIKAFWPEDRTIQPPPSNNELQHDRITLAEHFQSMGYATGFFGKWHLGNAETFWPTHHGFDLNIGGCGFGGPPTYFDPYRIPTLASRKQGEYLTDRLADEAIDYIRRQHERPMFICLWTYNPHYPFEAPEELIKPYQGKEGPGLKNPIYGAQLEATDRAIGRVLTELDKQNLADNTLVIFTSDNGGWSGATDNQPLRSGKGYLHEGGLRVPLIIRWPGHATAGDIIKTPVISMDLTATMIDAVDRKTDSTSSGKDAPKQHAGETLTESTLDGQSLLPLLRGKKLKRDALFFHYPHFAFHKANRPGSAIRRGKYKLILHYDDESIELYDLSNDIGETNNLAESRPAVANNLRTSLEHWLNETDADRPTKITQK